MKNKGVKRNLIAGLFVLSAVLFIAGLVWIFQFIQGDPFYMVEELDCIYRDIDGILVSEDGKSCRIYSAISGRTETYEIVSFEFSDDIVVKGITVSETFLPIEETYKGYRGANTPQHCLVMAKSGKKYVYTFKTKTLSPLFSGVGGLKDECGKNLLPIAPNAKYFITQADHVFTVIKRCADRENITFEKEVLTVDLSQHNPIQTEFVGWLDEKYFAFILQTESDNKTVRSYMVCDAETGEYRTAKDSLQNDPVSFCFDVIGKKDQRALANLLNGEKISLDSEKIPLRANIVSVSPGENYICLESVGMFYLFNPENGKCESVDEHVDARVTDLVFLHRNVILIRYQNKAGKAVSAVYRVGF